MRSLSETLTFVNNVIFHVNSTDNFYLFNSHECITLKLTWAALCTLYITTKVRDPCTAKSSVAISNITLSGKPRPR